MNQDIMVRVDRKIHKTLSAYGSIKDKKVKQLIGEILVDFIENRISKEDWQAIDKFIKRHDFS
jgi:phosphoribosyl-dephospho-CoA transferase